MITNAATQASNVVGLVFVAAFAPEEGERLGEVESGSKDSALVALKYPTGQGAQTAMEFAINPAQLQAAFAADLSAEQAAILAATQRPVAELAFSEPSWAVVATGDKAAGSDVIRAMARRAGATITDVILSAVAAVGETGGRR